MPAERIYSQKITDEDFCQSGIILLETNKSCNVLPTQSPKKTSIWQRKHYQRKERTRRRREKKEKGQQRITNFYPVLTQIVQVINDNWNEQPDLRKELVVNLSDDPQGNDCVNKKDVQGLLELLLKISENNATKANNKNIYSTNIKKFALYLFYVGGRLLYETLQDNLKNVLPSISALNRFARKERKLSQEGVFDYEGLHRFLSDRNLEKVVWISEDATRISGEIFHLRIYLGIISIFMFR